MYFTVWLSPLHTHFFIHASHHTSPVGVGVCCSSMRQCELTYRENGATWLLRLVEKWRKRPSFTAAARNDSVCSEKTGTLFCFFFIAGPLSVCWSPRSVHECGVPPCPWNSDPRVSSFSHAFFFSLSQLWLDALQGQSCEAMAHIFICQRPSFSYPLAALSPVSLVVLKLQEFEGNCCLLTAMSNAKKKKSLAIEIKIQDFSFYFNVFNHPVSFLLS